MQIGLTDTPTLIVLMVLMFSTFFAAVGLTIGQIEDHKFRFIDTIGAIVCLFISCMIEHGLSTQSTAAIFVRG
jgi:hypothetical protein